MTRQTCVLGEMQNIQRLACTVHLCWPGSVGHVQEGWRCRPGRLASPPGRVSLCHGAWWTTGCTGPRRQRETDLCAVRPGRRRAAVRRNRREAERTDEVSENFCYTHRTRAAEFGSRVNNVCFALGLRFYGCIFWSGTPSVEDVFLLRIKKRLKLALHKHQPIFEFIVM